MLQALSPYAAIYLSFFLQLTGLILAVMIDPYIMKRHRRIMLMIVALVSCLILQNAVHYLMDEKGGRPLARTVVIFLGYSMRPLLIVLFYYIVSDRKHFRPAWALIAANAVVYASAFFFDAVFSIDESDRCIHGPLGNTCHIVSAVLLVYLLYLTIRKSGHIRKFDAALPLFNAFLIVIAVVADSLIDDGKRPVSFWTAAVVSSSLLYYIWLHLQFVRVHENAITAEQRIRIMMSQIQPHFLFNTLSTIQALCRISPEKAFDTLGAFGVYLRQNIDSLNETDLIPFEKELEHTRVYTQIEKIRFPSVQVNYEINDNGFLVPSLSVQPLVENAIRHGVRIRQQGIVTVCAYPAKNEHIITIADNGVGFDTASLETLDETHIGIRNVRERIEKLCAGTLTVTSRENEGTTVIIRLPAEKELP